MSRNRYAAVLLFVLVLTLWGAGRYVDHTTAALCSELQAAQALALHGQSAQAQQAYAAAAHRAQDASGWLALFVRRNLVDQLGQTLQILPAYSSGEDLRDLTAETARACCQLQQIRQSFFGCF